MQPPDLFAPRRKATFVTSGKRYSRSKRFDERQARIEKRSVLTASANTVAAIAIFQLNGIGFDCTCCTRANALGTSGVGVSVCERNVEANSPSKIDNNNAILVTDLFVPLMFLIFFGADRKR